MRRLLGPTRWLMIWVLAATLGGCGAEESGGGSGAGGPASGKNVDPSLAEPDVETPFPEFRRSLGEPEYLDPNKISENEGGTVTLDTFEGLYRYGPTADDIRPGVAERHEVSEDGKTYTFYLRKNAKWSDGKPVTAHDFVYSWKRLLDPATASRYTEIMSMIVGAEAFSKSSAAERDALREKVGVEALDDHTLKVDLLYPTPYFISLTAFYSFCPLPRHVIEAHGDQWTRPENIASNGPWVMIERKQQERIVTERNPHYWNPTKVPFERVVYRIFENQEPAHNLYKAGGLDFLDSRIPPNDLPTYIANQHPELHSQPQLAVYYYMFNVAEPPFDNVLVRRALNMAVNKPDIGRAVAKGGQAPAYSIVHPELASVGYRGPTGPTFDPDTARDLLAEAGFEGGEGFPTFKISYNTLEGHKQIAVFIQQQWKQNLGIDAEPDNMEWKVLLKKHQSKEFQVSRAAWIGDYIDPMTFLDLWRGANPQNHTNWSNDRFDDLIEQARREVNSEKRMQLLAEAEQIFIDEVPAMPIYFYVDHDLVKPWVSGHYPHLQDIHPARYFRITARP